MARLPFLPAAWALVALCAAACAAEETGGVFWPLGEWVAAAPAEEGMDARRLEEAMDFARDGGSTALFVARHGRVVAERYWEEGGKDKAQPADAALYALLSTLAGVALQEGHVESLEQKASDFLGEWRGSDRDMIALRHLLSMTSGLADEKTVRSRRDPGSQRLAGLLELEPAEPAGTQWKLHPGALRLLLLALERAAGRSPSDWARESLFEKLGMRHATFRRVLGPRQDRWRVEATAADLGRLGLLWLCRGVWNGDALLPSSYVEAAWDRSQFHNPAFGYLWWRNGTDTHRLRGRKARGMILPGCPADARLAMDARENLLCVVPSLSLVAVRLGRHPRKGTEEPRPRSFRTGLLGRLCGCVDAWRGRSGPPAPAAGDPAGEEALLARLSELHVARRQGDVVTFRRVAREVQALWKGLPPDARDRIEARYPGIGRRIERGFE